MMEPAAPPARSPWPTFVVCAVATYITALDLSVVNVAFAEIAKSFPTVSRSGISWVVTAYSIVFGSLLVVAGRTADRLGRRRVFLLGAGMFLVGSFTCGIAPAMPTLIAGRVIQGIGGALLTPASTGLLLGAFDLDRRTLVIAWTGGVGALGVASGPTVGALLISAFGWRAAFWINLPICLFVLVFGARVLHESPRQTGTRPDVVSAALVTLSVAGVVLAISEGRGWGWTSPAVIGLVVGAVVLGVVVVLRSRSHPSPVLPVDLFHERTFAAANVGSLLFGGAFAGMALTNVLFLRGVWGYSVLRAGMFSVLSPVTVAIVSTFAGRFARTRGFRTLLIGGPLLFAVTEVLFATILHDGATPWTRWLPLAVLLGASIGCTLPVLSAAAVQALPTTRFAVGSAVNNTFRQVGSAVGVAVVVAVQSSSSGIRGFRLAWIVCAVGAAGAALVALGALRPRRAAAAEAVPA